MASIGKSAKFYMERRLPKYQQTLRGPGPQVNLGDNPVHDLTLNAPKPLPAFLYNRKYVSGGKTQPWPSGNCGECK
jgi:hypothetical protein